MFLPWFIALTLTLQSCAAEKSCVFRSSAGSVVQWGSSFEVSCTFNGKCKGSMYRENTLLSHKKLNSTTIYFKVEKITEKITYSCSCSCNEHEPKSRCHSLDPCGQDISPGYLPDRPKNISCVYEMVKSESGFVTCIWDRGRDTHLKDRFLLKVKTVSEKHRDGPVEKDLSSKETETPSATFSLSRSVQTFLVWVQAQNDLGSVKSLVVNYTVSDIRRPSAPVLSPAECSSRNCIVQVNQTAGIQNLQIQFRADQYQQWTTHPDPVVSTNSSQNIWSLEPYRLYHFRARSKFSTGLWSLWSSIISSWTQEEAPAQALDVWFAHTPNFQSMKIYWKEAKMSISSGRIVQYVVKIYSQNLSMSVSADVSNCSVPFCADCEVTVQASNSKGHSPPAKITTQQKKAKSLFDVEAKVINSTVSISWRKAGTAVTAYVVEWFPEGLMLEELRWVRLDQNHTRTLLTGLMSSVCYAGAVYAFSNMSLIGGSKFTPVATLESVPEIGPSVKENVKGDKVVIAWRELSRAQRRGCITGYTIYLESHENNQTHLKLDSVRASEKTYIIRNLSPGLYSLWMSASTTKGEGPASQKIKFYIVEDPQLYPLIMCVCAVLAVPFLCYLCKSSAVKQRFRQIFSCLIPDVPDPANSKWAKECTKDKGKMIFQLPPGNSSIPNNEDETILVNVEEIFKRHSDTYTLSKVLPRLPIQTSLSPETELTTMLYPARTTYIKSFSHDSDSSNHTKNSLDTNTTVGYISLHGSENLDTYHQEEEEPPMRFFPSLSLFTEPLELRGIKLTLDAVKIDCSDFFQNAYCDSEI